jgi:hypothetical protein
MEPTNGGGGFRAEGVEPPPEKLHTEKLYSVNDAAELLAMHPESLRREIRSGEIRVEKLSPLRGSVRSQEPSQGRTPRRGALRAGGGATGSS